MFRRKKRTVLVAMGLLGLLCYIQIHQIHPSTADTALLVMDGNIGSENVPHHAMPHPLVPPKKSNSNNHLPKQSNLIDDQLAMDENKTVHQMEVMKAIMDIAPAGKGNHPNEDDVIKNLTAGPFSEKMSPAERAIAYDLLAVLHKVMMSSNLTYWIYSGTLLGSYRHHDLIPWDDDIDIITDIDTRDKLMEELATLAPTYTLFKAGNRLKFFRTNAQQTSQYPWTFPYVDISFYKDNGSNVFDYSDNQDMGDFMFVYDKSKLFPLHLRPLGTLMVNSPHDTYANLLSTYPNLNICQSAHYLHRTESLVGGSQATPCERFKDRVPFVHRSQTQYGMKETLMLGAKTLHHMYVPEPHYAIPNPYTLTLP